MLWSRFPGVGQARGERGGGFDAGRSQSLPIPVRQNGRGHPVPQTPLEVLWHGWPWPGRRQCRAAAGEALSQRPGAESSPCARLWPGRGGGAPCRGACAARTGKKRGWDPAVGTRRARCSARLSRAAELFESPLLESEEEHLLLDPGNALKLYCDVNQSGASVVWYKESRPLLPGPRVRLQQSVLEIAEVAYEDSGLYVCRARGTGEVLRNFTISVVGEGPEQRRGEHGPISPSCRQGHPS